jgi:hypothetical protein
LSAEDTNAVLTGVVVANGPPRANIGNPRQILVEYLDIHGAVVGSHYEWNPRWERFESEGGKHLTEISAEGTGSFQVPLSIEIQQVRLSEMADDGPPIQLLVADVASVIAEFCISTPDDPNCEAVPPEDADNDGIPDQSDNCPETWNPGQDDLDNNGVGDTCDLDDDGDSVLDTADICPQTVFPETVLTTDSLKKNRWALSSDGSQFFQAPPQSGSKFQFSTADTGGCSCEQISKVAELGRDHLRSGCSTSAILNWIDSL